MIVPPAPAPDLDKTASLLGPPSAKSLALFKITVPAYIHIYPPPFPGLESNMPVAAPPPDPSSAAKESN